MCNNSHLKLSTRLSSPSYVALPDSPVSSPAVLSTRLLSEKPLPSPPIARVSKNNSIREARSLIDASERPLRRSPPGMPHKQEEWPALSPEKLTTAGTSQRKLHKDRLPASPDAVYMSSAQIERYPSFGRSSPPTMMRDRKFATIAPSSQNFVRKKVPSPKSSDELVAVLPSAELLKPAKQQVPNDKVSNQLSSVATSESASFTAVSELSASAATVEKLAYEAPTIGQPRQTRTSSLRARLSAGQVIKGDTAAKTKVRGFADFTAADAVPGNTSKGNLRDPEEVRTRPQGQPVAKLYKKMSSEGPLRANRAPAQFVGGSRRAVPHRPSSLGSIRNESRTSTPVSTIQPPTRPAPLIPVPSGLPEPPRIVKLEFSKNAEPRRSSIPISRHTVLSMVSQTENEMLPTNNKQEDRIQVNNVPRSGFEIFEDRATDSLSEQSNGPSIDQLVVGQPEGIPTGTSETYNMPVLQAIEESPKQDYHIKRLSVISPEYGPTLKISSSADRLIMGFRSGEDERLTYSLPTNHLHQDSAKPIALTIRKSTEIPVIDDPFFEAQSTNDQDQANATASIVPDTTLTASIVADTIPTANEETLTIDEESWISPMHNKKQGASNGIICINASKSMPIILQDQDSKDSNTNRKSSTAAMSVQEVVNVFQPFSDATKGEENVTVNFPSTPERSSSTAGNSTSFPPRSSSRTTPPDYTIKESAKSSPISPLEVEKCQTRFLERQNKLGSSKGHASCSLDISQAAVSKRDSIARESGKSQGSISKGMLSNIRGLFHKRSAENGLHSSTRSNKKGKQHTLIASSGSPFPPISEIHPIHRPTLASNNRSNAKCRKGIGYDTIANTPITPSISSPLPSEISTTTTLAMQLLESARTERSSPKKERALELGTILVEAITQARDAEKAMEEAKHAARKAEVAHALCKKSVGDIAKKVLEWKDDLEE